MVAAKRIAQGDDVITKVRERTSLDAWVEGRLGTVKETTAVMLGL